MSKPPIVLVHGSFADASGWAGVITRLEADGFSVLAPPNLLRGIPTDAAYIRDFLGTIEGDVVLGAHSYGGAVITNAATGLSNVKALVYIAAFALEEGEAVAQATALGGSTANLLEAIDIRPFPGAAEGDGDGYLKREIFHPVFCQDLPDDVATAMYAGQRPGALASFVIPSGPPAWKQIPSFYLVASQDRVIDPAAERVMAERSNSVTVEIDSSHVAMISHPDEVADLIRQAAASIG
jgi:pimeloyl-ACP methyl ester carboxylesterase